MADVVDRETRSRMMAGIRGTNTRPEILVRHGLHALGFRYRLHDRRLPGKPDLVLPKWNAVIFVHGCFWHGHNCHLFKWPKSRADFWRTKIKSNQENDQRTETLLRELGWRVCVVWECVLKGKLRRPVDDVIRGIAEWLRSERVELEISAKAVKGDRGGRTSGNKKPRNHHETDGG